MIIKTFAKLKLPLKVFGKEFGGLRLKESGIRNHESRIEYLGEVSDEEKLELMRNAKAFIFASEDEDFGITPVEAMTAGAVPILYDAGGHKEIIKEGVNGFIWQSISSLINNPGCAGFFICIIYLYLH